MVHETKTYGLGLSSAMVIGAGVLWGCISLFVKSLGALGLSSMEISGVRMFIAVVGMALVLLARDRSLFKIRLRDLWIFVGMGMLSITLFNVCYFQCIKLSEASIAVILLYTSPIWVMLMSALFFKERITARKLVALVMTMVGCVLVTGLLGGAVHLTPLAFGLGLCSGIFYATYSIFGRVALKRYNTLTTTFYTFLMGAVCSLFISHPLRLANAAISNPRTALLMLGIGVFCTILPYLLYTKGLEGMETGRAAILATAEPVVAALLGILVYHESTGPLKIVGILLIFAAVVILNLREKDSPHCEQEQP